jgi:uncharacterized protein
MKQNTVILSLIAGFLLAFGGSCATPKASVRYHTFRLSPGQDLLNEIQSQVQKQGARAGAIVTAVGSLTQSSIRYANRPNRTLVQKDLELVSLVGTVARSGSHLHLTVSDAKGQTLGGHLMEGSLVRTTAEIVWVEFLDREFTREFDPASGYPELKVVDQVGDQP